MASVETLPSSTAAVASGAFGAASLTWTRRALMASAWLSAALFGFYILAFYAAAALDGDFARWNESLPNLYAENAPAATRGIGLHFAAGGVILALGCIQVVGRIRRRFPALHRWIGRIYVIAALCAGVGGLVFILAKRTIGGVVMDVGFGLYGALMMISAVQAYRHARARNFDVHRAWALRLFALAIGSWLYRMAYGFWFILADGAGHTKSFQGPFDLVMDFAFYIPSLLLVEMILRTQRSRPGPVTQVSLAAVFALATVFIAVGTYHATRYFWGPAILAQLGV